MHCTTTRPSSKDTSCLDIYIIFCFVEGPCRWEKFEGKYLDFNIELSEVKEAAHLKSIVVNEVPKNHPPIPPDVKAKVPSIPPPARFAYVYNLIEAIELCDKRYPLCEGVQKENSEEKYSLRKSRIPRHVVNNLHQSSVGRQDTGSILPSLIKKNYFPNKTAFIIYCPGELGYFQAVKKPLVLDVEKRSVWNHTYSFAVHFSVSLFLLNSAHIPAFTYCGWQPKVE